MGDRLPFMPIPTGEHLASTAHLTAEQQGALFLLMCHYWNNGQLPTGDVQLSAIARLSSRRWKANRLTLAPFFGGNWGTHSYLDEQRARALRLRLQKQTAGAKGGFQAAVNRANVSSQLVSIIDARIKRHSAATAPATAFATVPLEQPEPEPKINSYSEQDAARAREAEPAAREKEDVVRSNKRPSEATPTEIEEGFARKARPTTGE